MDIHTLRHVHNQFDIGIIIIIGSSGDIDVLVGHANVVCVGMQAFWGSHHGELDCPFIEKGLVGPFPHGSNLLDGGDPVVGDKGLPRKGSVHCARMCRKWNTHARMDDGVTIVTGHEVLHVTRRGDFEVVPADEM